MSSPFIDFTGADLPLTLIYSEVYSNVSGQVLEIDKSLVQPGHLWSRLFSTRFLIGADYTDRGFITQKLIDLGYIAKAVYSPVIPLGFFYMQSYESETWFQVDAIEVDTSPDHFAVKQDDASFQTTKVTGPSEDSIINFNIIVPAGVWFILGLANGVSCVGMQLDSVDQPDDISFLYVKRNIQQFPLLPEPMAVPNSVSLIFYDQNNNRYSLQVDDSGQLFFTPYFGFTPFSLLNSVLLPPNGDPNLPASVPSDCLFWDVVEPLLEQIPDERHVRILLNSPDPVQASYSGVYTGPSGYAGTVSFEWRLEDVADSIAGTFPGYGTSPDGLWTTSGSLTISGILAEPSWGTG